MAEASFDAAPSAAENFRVGRVFNRAVNIQSRNFVKFFVLSAIPLLPYLIAATFVAMSRPALRSVAPPDQARVMAGAGAVIALGLLMLFLYTFSQAVVLYGAFQAMRGRSFSIGESLGRGFARFLPIIGLLFCMGVAWMVGALLLIVPAFIVMCMLYVSLPACVVERLGPFESMGRSAALTKGHRWRIFGLVLLLWLISVVGLFVISRLAAALGGVAVGTICAFIWNTAYGAFGAIVAVVAYHDLRVAKEGIDIDRIAAVFD